MSKLYLHIGMHKTGTTAIQNVLAANIGNLERVGYCYPAIGMSGPTHAGWVNCIDFPSREASIAQMMKGYRKERSVYAANNTFDELFDELVQEVELRPDLDFVLSSECFTEWVDPQVYASAFSKLFSSVEVVIYLREQTKWLASLTNQYYKDSSFRFDGNLVATPFRELLDYAQLIDLWAECFGKHSVVIRRFVEGDGFDSVKDFLMQVLSISAQEAEQFDQITADANRSVDANAFALLKYYNCTSYDVKTHEELKRLISFCEFTHENAVPVALTHSALLDTQTQSLVDVSNKRLWKLLNVETPWW